MDNMGDFQLSDSDLADIEVAATKQMKTTEYRDQGHTKLAAAPEIKTSTSKDGISNTKVSEDKPLIAYLHNLSPIKKSQRDNMYFNMTLQTEGRAYRSVCFSPEKHQRFLAKYESSSPLKISKFQLKRNDRTNEDEIHINKRTKMEDPLDSEVSFDIKKIESQDTSSSVYSVSKIVVREYEKAKYLTLNKMSVIEKSAVSITRQDGDAEGLPNTSKVDCPAEGVLSIQRFSSCKKCQSKLIRNGEKMLVKCSECGLAQLFNKCQQRLIANVMFEKAGNTLSLLLFEDKIKHLYEIYKTQVGETTTFESLDDDNIMEFLLMVEATLCYNAKKNVVSVHKKN